MPPAQSPPSARAVIACAPALPAAIAFILGVMLHRAMPSQPLLWTCIAISLALVTFVFRSSITSALLIFALILVAAAAAQMEDFFFPRSDIANFTSNDQRLCRIRMQIVDPPRILDAAANSRSARSPRQITQARVEQVLSKSGWRRASGTVLLNLQPPLESLHASQHIEALGLLRRPAPALNPGQFDWSSYYRDQRILAAVMVPRADVVRVIADEPESPLTRLRQKTRALLAAGFSRSHSIDHALLRALVLGDSDPELRDVQEDFRRTGTSHHLAISGLHVAILGLIIYQLCRLLRMRPRWAVTIGLALVLLYGIVVLPSPPVIRSILLYLAFAVGILFGRTARALQLLALTILMMLVVRPLDLYGAGFQLSFGTVLGLILFTRYVYDRLVQSDPDVQIALAHRARVPVLERIKLRAQRIIIGPLAAGVVAWAVSLPLIAWHFEQLNPWAVFASIFLAIPVFFALVAGFLKIILTLAIPAGATWWASGAGFFVALMRKSVEALAQLPGSDRPFPSPPIWLIVLYYALLILPFIPSARALFRRAIAVAPATALGLLALVPLTGAAPSRTDQSLKLTVLSVGAGLCNVIELPDNHTILIDAGSSTVTDLQRRTLAPFLRHEACNGIDSLFLSHRDFDHISAAAETLDALSVREVVFSPHFRRFAMESAPARDLIHELDRTHHQTHTIAAGQTLVLSRDATVQVLWPPENCALDSNDTGLVLRLTCAGRSILFPADIQEPAETELLKHPEQLKSDFLIAPHHGSAELTTRAFIDAVNPIAIISSNDHTLTHKQKLFNRLNTRPLYRTDECGAVTVTIKRDGNIKFDTFVRK